MSSDKDCGSARVGDTVRPHEPRRCTVKVERFDHSHIAKHVEKHDPLKSHNEACIPDGATVQESPKIKIERLKQADKLLCMGVKNMTMLEHKVVTNVVDWPWCTVGIVYWGSPDDWDNWLGQGSGVLVGRSFIATASHVVPQDRGDNFWMRFYPAYNQGPSGYGFSYVTNIKGYSNTDNVVEASDFVICKLDIPLGDTSVCGYMGSQGSQGNDFYYNGVWTSVGYPRFGELKPIVEEGVKVDDVDTTLYDFKELESNVYHDHGWSGGPLWAFIDGHARVIAVLSGLEGEPSLDIFDGFVAEHTVNAGGPALNALVSWGRSNWD